MERRHELRQYLLSVRKLVFSRKTEDEQSNGEIKVEFASFNLGQFVDLDKLVELEIARKYGSFCFERLSMKRLLLQ
jgi:hypothetical protein